MVEEQEVDPGHVIHQGMVADHAMDNLQKHPVVHFRAAQSTGAGSIGVSGELAQDLVEVGQNRDLDFVFTQGIMVDHAEDKAQKQYLVHLSLVRSMALGIIGGHGRAVVEHVEEEPKKGTGTVMVLDMEEGVVLGQHRNQDLAKPIHVPQVEANAAFWEYSAAN